MKGKTKSLHWFLGISCLFLFLQGSFAQEKIKASGTIVDSKNNTALIGATISVEGGATTMADENGKFEISVPAKSKLRISMTGFATKTVTAAQNLVITLSSASVNLEEAIIVGYTTQKRNLMTGSVATVKLKQADIEVPTTSAGNLLAGRMSGVQVSTPNGLPGSQPAITIRTPTSTFLNSTPAASVLFVIDGKISGSGDFNNLSPNEIADMTVLKDAATTAAYGSRGAGGVILVTTKRGSAGKTSLNYSFNTGYDQRGKNMDLTSAVEWGIMHARIWGMGVGGPAGSPWTPTAEKYFSENDFGGGKGYGFDLLNDVYRDPMTTTHNISASGGSDKVRYFIGGSYVNQQDFIKNTYFKKYNVRANITADLNKDFSVFAGITLNDNQTSAPVGDLGGDIYSKLLVWQPYMPSYTRTGLPVDYFWISNKSGEADGLAGYNKSQNIKPVLNLSLTYKVPFLKGLSAKGTYIKSYTNYNQKIYQHPFTYYQLKQIEPIIWDLDNIVSSRLTAHTPSVEKISSWAQDNQLNLQLNFERTFGKSNVNGALVYERFEASGEGMDASIANFPLYTTDQWWASTGGGGVVNGTATKSVSNSYGNYSLTGRKSWIGQFMYDYDGKYVANFTYRYDGSMKFDPEQRWGFFPAGSVGWVMSKENFLQNSKTINMLKLRASVGLTGNDNVRTDPNPSVPENLFQWQDAYRAGSSAIFGTTPGLYPGLQYNVLPNPNITWEKYLNKNIGIDIAFLDHFNASLEYWHNYTYDILGLRIQTTPPTFSRPLPAVNYGKQKGQGIDFSLDYHNMIGKAFKFNVGVVASYGNSWYVEKDQNVTYDYQNQIGNGRKTTMVTGYQVNHMLRTQGDVDAWVKAHPGYKFNGFVPQPGQMVYDDLASQRGMGQGDSVINNYDIAVLRKQNNPVVVGLNLGAEWKGFSIQATFNGSLGYLKSTNDLSGGVEWNRMWRQWYADSWSTDNPNATLPKQYSANDGTRTVNYSGSNFWLADASFVRLKLLNVAYTVPTKLYKKYIAGIRVFVSGSNLFVISKFNKDYYDPEMASGVAFPIVKSYNAGVSVSF